MSFFKSIWWFTSLHPHLFPTSSWEVPTSQLCDYSVLAFHALISQHSVPEIKSRMGAAPKKSFYSFIWKRMSVFPVSMTTQDLLGRIQKTANSISIGPSFPFPLPQDSDHHYLLDNSLQICLTSNPPSTENTFLKYTCSDATSLNENLHQ